MSIIFRSVEISKLFHFSIFFFFSILFFNCNSPFRQYAPSRDWNIQIKIKITLTYRNIRNFRLIEISILVIRFVKKLKFSNKKNQMVFSDLILEICDLYICRLISYIHRKKIVINLKNSIIFQGCGKSWFIIWYFKHTYIKQCDSDAILYYIFVKKFPMFS